MLLCGPVVVEEKLVLPTHTAYRSRTLASFSRSPQTLTNLVPSSNYDTFLLTRLCLCAIDALRSYNNTSFSRSSADPFPAHTYWNTSYRSRTLASFSRSPQTLTNLVRPDAILPTHLNAFSTAVTVACSYCSERRSDGRVTK